MRPTGPLHLGHLLGALDNWVKLQAGNECFFMIADLHALMGEYENPAGIEKNSIEMAIDWIACGVDPAKSVVFVQSRVPEHSELALVLGMLTPLGWLERNPTYKEQLREIRGRDLTTFGFLGYPVLQAADILLYKADRVPVGEDQLAHLELAREITRRFRHLYKKDVFPEPQAMLTKEARILGTDRRKMSKSYDNAINLSDSDEVTRRKTLSMLTDPERVRLEDPGHPDICNVFSYHKIFADTQAAAAARDWCSNAKKGCVECKGILADRLIERLAPIRKKRQELTKDKGLVKRVLDEGTRKASERARETMDEVKQVLHLSK